MATLERAMRRVGTPGVLKTRRFGYDGKGQYVLRPPPMPTAALAALGSVPLLYEEFVPFDYEVSVIGARSRRGEIAIYPLNRNLSRRRHPAPDAGAVARARIAAARQRTACGVCCRRFTTSVC